MNKSLEEIQAEIKEWSYHNFGAQPSWRPLLGIGEEVGELNHHFLKRDQKIRTNEDHDEGIEDSIGDIMVYLLDFCGRENLNANYILNRTWEQVKNRDWNKNSTNGQTSS